MSIGRMIYEGRRRLGWSQAKLANKLNISRVTLGRYEKDKQNPDFEVFLKLLDIFDISADAFLERDMDRLIKEREYKFLEELRKEKTLYQNAMKYPRIEIQKLKNLY